MDIKQSEEQAKNYNGYQGYGEEIASADMVEKVIKRDMSLLEYDVDRDVILDAIKNALKERNYEEAQEFVFQYRAAAKQDETFAVLAKMTEDGIRNKKDVDRIQVVLDATPEDDYEVRLSLSEKMYKLISSDENLEQVNKYRRLLKKPVIEKAVADKSSNVPAPVVNEVRGAVSFIAKGTCAVAGVVSPLLIILFLAMECHPAAIVPLICGAIYNWVSFASLKKTEHTAADAFKKMLLNTAVLLVGFVVAFLIGWMLRG